MKKLPVVINPIVTSECWTYYKMAIIQALPSYRAWLALNMMICMEENGWTEYGIVGGNINGGYEQSDYSSIFDIKEEDFTAISEEDIIEYLISKIDHGNYMILIVDYNLLRAPDYYDGDQWFHEALIYGYDREKRCFFAPVLKQGGFKDTSISFDLMKEAYKLSRDHYIEKYEEAFEKKYWYFVITKIKPKEDYIPANIYNEYIARLDKEDMGGRFDKYILNDNNEFSYHNTYYIGALAQLHAAELLRTYANEGEEKIKLHNIRKAILHIAERIQILYEGMLWFINDIGAENKAEVLKMTDEFISLINRNRQNILLVEKYAITEDKSILLRTADRIEQNYKIEKELIGKYKEYVKEQCVLLRK